MKVIDCLIVGAGPIGIACGAEAVRRGFSHILFDKGCLCYNIYRFPTHMTFFSTSDKLEIAGIPFPSAHERPTRLEALEYYRRVAEHFKINLHLYEEVLGGTWEGEFWRVCTPKNPLGYPARSVILATGFYDIPRKLKVPGEHLPHVHHYFQDGHPFAFLDVVVVGGGNSAVQAAMACHRKGAKVTMVVKNKTLDWSVKYWLKPAILNRIKEGSLQAYFRSRITRIEEDKVTVKTPQGTLQIPAQAVLCMIGYQPDLSLLKRFGIPLTRGRCPKPQYHKETFETPLHNLFVAGVLCGGMKTNRWFIETARYHVSPIFDCLAERL